MPCHPVLPLPPEIQEFWGILGIFKDKKKKKKKKKIENKKKKNQELVASYTIED